MMKKRIILVLIPHYLPGYKWGGPTRTLANMVDRLGDEFIFKIITLDRDMGDTQPYKGIAVNEWHSVGKAEVYYISRDKLSFGKLKKFLNELDYNLLYLNSFFHWIFTIKPIMLNRLGEIPKRPIIIAPRGEFSTGALAIKRFKKSSFIYLARSMNLYRDVIWQASSDLEMQDIKRTMGVYNKIIVAPNIPKLLKNLNERSLGSRKVRGYLKLIFLSRIARKKNLTGALEILKHIQGRIEFNIYGTIEDEKYWRECNQAIQSLPDSISVNYKGAIPNEQVTKIMLENDLFFFPTHGENFGHVIYEALASARPVLISDTTPWQNLEKKNVGWDIPLDDKKKFQAIIKECIKMSRSEHQALCKSALSFASDILVETEIVNKNRQLFYSEIEST